MKKYKIMRILIGVLTGLIALTSIGGGIAMLVGVEAERFPLEWLQGTPFKDYTIPALLLAIAVGGSSLMACITTFINHKASPFLVMIAGLTLMGYITVEVLLLKQVPPGPTLFEVIYFGLGLLILGLAVFLWRAEVMRKPTHSQPTSL